MCDLAADVGKFVTKFVATLIYRVFACVLRYVAITIKKG